MKYLFSAKTLAFYPESEKDSYIQSGTLPDDVVAVSSDLRDEFNFTPPLGKMLGAIGNSPVWVDIPPPSHEQLVSQADQQRNQLRKAADAEIAWLSDAVDAAIATENEINLLAEWKKYRVLLMRVHLDDVPAIEWPQVPDGAADVEV